jgi:hypothetical protein
MEVIEARNIRGTAKVIEHATVSRQLAAADELAPLRDQIARRPLSVDRIAHDERSIRRVTGNRHCFCAHTGMQSAYTLAPEIPTQPFEF